MTEITHNPENLYYKVSELLKQAQSNVVQTVNKTMVTTYFEIGRMIVEEEQKGKERAEYGQQLINELSYKLSTEFGKGFSPTNIKQMRSFYLIYSKGQTVSDEFNLSWSHYLKLMRITNIEERHFYEIESVENNWSLSDLKRQYDSLLYERLALTKNINEVMLLSQKGQIIEKPAYAIKNPYVLELPIYSEIELENKIIWQM